MRWTAGLTLKLPRCESDTIDVGKTSSSAVCLGNMASMAWFLIESVLPRPTATFLVTSGQYSLSNSIVEP